MNGPPPTVTEIAAACGWAILTPPILSGALLSLALGPLFPLGLLFAVTYGAPIAAVHVLFVWLPAWLLISQRWTPNIVAAGALGFVCGALPVTIASRTWEAYAGETTLAVFFGACGVVGGVTFWWRLYRDRL